MIFVQSPIRSNWLIMCFQIGDVMHDSKAFVKKKCLRTCTNFTANNDTESMLLTRKLFDTRAREDMGENKKIIKNCYVRFLRILSRQATGFEKEKK